MYAKLKVSRRLINGCPVERKSMPLFETQIAERAYDGFGRSHTLKRSQNQTVAAVCKRLTDVTGAAVLLLFFLPFLLAVSIFMWAVHGGPVFFRHRRIGRDGRSFECLKFRTMRTDSDRILAECLKNSAAMRSEWAQTRKFKRDPRVHAIGNLLRKSSLDELPQLINVLRGDMSLVGPRPIVDDEAKNYGTDFPYYLAMRPGITGLWQVSGRNNTTYGERVALDVRYFKEQSLVMDCRILLRTVRVVVTAHGAY